MKNTRLLLKALSVAFIACGSAAPAHAAYTITLQEIGGNVVATGSGSLNLTALFAAGGLPSWSNMMIPENGTIGVGPSFADAGLYTGNVTFPPSLGTGGMVLASSGTGSFVGAIAGGYVLVPLGYASGAPLGDSQTTFTGATFASLGLTPGQYVWSWGDGITADTLTVNVGAPPAPPPPPPTPPPPAVDPLAALKIKAAAITRVGTSLTDKLTLAETYFAVPDATAGCSMMKAFMLQVRALAGKKMTDAQAAELTSGAMDVMTFEGCQ